MKFTTRKNGAEVPGTIEVTASSTGQTRILFLIDGDSDLTITMDSDDGMRLGSVLTAADYMVRESLKENE